MLLIVITHIAKTFLHMHDVKTVLGIIIFYTCALCKKLSYVLSLTCTHVQEVK